LYEGWLLHFKLERKEGTPADRPRLKTAAINWSPGETIPNPDGEDAPSCRHPASQRRKTTRPALEVVEDEPFKF
jgi:hypothetical protein